MNLKNSFYLLFVSITAILWYTGNMTTGELYAQFFLMIGIGFALVINAIGELE